MNIDPKKLEIIRKSLKPASEAKKVVKNVMPDCGILNDDQLMINNILKKPIKKPEK